jgi:hypothetical protein
MYAANELLFPPDIIVNLRDSRGEQWKKLIDRVVRLPEDHPESLAFSLLMIRIDGCMRCETDSYRAMLGCTACAKQMLRRYKGPDEELIEAYHIARQDIEIYLETHHIQAGKGEERAARAA